MGLGLTGYMSLPVPVLGNTWANYTLILETPDNGFGDESIRSTPGPYWAVLWNRCFSIIDNHDHSTPSSNVGGSTGKKLQWAYGRESNAYDNLSSIKPDGDLELSPEPGFEYSVAVPNAYSLKNLKGYALSYKANIVNEIPTLTDRTFNNFGPSVYPLNSADPPDRFCLYSRLRYSRITYNTASTTGTDSFVDNVTYAPRIDLIWNDGSASKEGVTLVLNEPPGDKAKWWKFSSSPNPTNATSGYYNADTNQPYHGIVDKGEYGGAKQSITFSSNNDASMFPLSMNSYWWLATDPGMAAAGFLTLTLFDFLKTADPIQYPNQNQYSLANIPTPPLIGLWSFFAKDASGTNGPTAGTDQLAVVMLELA
jgi:hypothetical protein